MDSTEISSKIRAAIKAKLEELGAYADEELPDYIMVMVANKKTRQQMTEDLNLFLGKNAPIFTKWLHEVLERLSTLSKSGAKPKEAAKEKDAKSASSSSKKDKKEKEPKKSTSAKAPEEAPKAARKSDENAAPPAKEVDEILHIHADEEAQEEAAPPPPDKRRPETRQPLQTPAARERDRRRVSPPRHEHRRHDHRSRSRSPHRHQASSRRSPEQDDYRERRRRDERRRSRSPPRRSPPPRASRAEEYDPLRPEMIASTVSIPARPRYGSSTVQPEGNVFLRAMKDATKLTTITVTQSTASKRRSEDDKDVVTKGPAVRRERRASPVELARPSIKDRLGGRLAARSRSRSPVDLRRKNGVENLVIGLSGGPGDRRRVQIDEASSGGEDEMDDDVVPLATVGVAKRLQKTPPPPGEEEAPVKQKDRSPQPAAGPPPDDALEIFLAPNKEAESGGPRFTVTMEGVEEDFRARLEKKVGMSSSLETSTDSSTTTTTTTTSTDESLYGVRKGRSGGLQARLGVFTLPDTTLPPPPLPFLPNAALSAVGGGASVHQQQAYVSFQPPPTMATPPPSQAGGGKALRCRFWPNCTNDNCHFVHPTKECSNFPKCRFGAACLYIHPPCKFGPACTRPDCQFAHSAAAAAAPPPKAPKRKILAETMGKLKRQQRAGIAECRFGDACKNPKCSFNHSPMCKYGGVCTRSDCIFRHPDNAEDGETVMPPKEGGRAAITSPRKVKAEAAKYKWKKTPIITLEGVAT